MDAAGLGIVGVRRLDFLDEDRRLHAVLTDLVRVLRLGGSTSDKREDGSRDGENCTHNASFGHSLRRRRTTDGRYRRNMKLITAVIAASWPSQNRNIHFSNSKRS